MQRLIYISTSRGVIMPEDLTQILNVSRRNNAAVGLSGLLVAGGRRFLQALEGPVDAVQTTFRRIGADPRHYAVVTLRREVITARAFPDWTMGFRRAGAVANGGGLAAVVGALVSEIEDPTIRAYFTGFADMHAAA